LGCELGDLKLEVERGEVNVSYFEIPSPFFEIGGGISWTPRQLDRNATSIPFLMINLLT
jgi:hypothetical protein